MPRPKKVVAPKAKSAEDYVIEFAIGSDVYTGEGSTMLEALNQIKPKRYMGLCKVTATVGGRVSKLPIKLVPTNMRRLFEKPIEMAMFAKRLQTLL